MIHFPKASGKTVLWGACCLAFTSVTTFCQDYRWQQRVEYTMNVRLDVKTHMLSGTQKLVYFNNSPDTLKKIYYHLYFNAFQPGSMMDVRSRTISDPDPKIGDRISKLKAGEIGFQRILALTQDHIGVTHKTLGTILEVTLAKPLLPKARSVLDMKFEAQVPIQVRRCGRDNKEGIAYTMTQWYPKLAEYDYQGWHADQYVFREFHGVWGDFDVTLTLDPTFVVAGTGVLQNPEKAGHGYEKAGVKIKPSLQDMTWHFVARDVIDFAWAADPDFAHDVASVPNGPELHFFYQKDENIISNWKNLQPFAVKTFEYMNSHFGKYPFNTYSIIQGGDGGTEYPMCTMITGVRSPGSLVGVMTHEVAHSWFQMALASNESLYPWMDEGFTDFAANETKASFYVLPNPHAGSYNNYFALVASGLQEPASQHGDHFTTNRAYTTAAYAMGSIFLNQLQYLIGESDFHRGMLLYYNTWKMRHPEPNDLVRVMEKVSGLQLHWYLRYWIGTTKRIDYGIEKVSTKGDSTLIILRRIGEFPMPIDLMVTYEDGTRELVYIPMSELLGSKDAEMQTIKSFTVPTWMWVEPTYNLLVPGKRLTAVEIDPSERMADIDRKNNKWTAEP